MNTENPAPNVTEFPEQNAGGNGVETVRPPETNSGHNYPPGWVVAVVIGLVTLCTTVVFAYQKATDAIVSHATSASLNQILERSAPVEASTGVNSARLDSIEHRFDSIERRLDRQELITSQNANVIRGEFLDVRRELSAFRIEHERTLDEVKNLTQYQIESNRWTQRAIESSGSDSSR